MKYEKLTNLSIRQHPELSERWVQDRIAADPSILGLGDVVLIDKERNQVGAGRLDLLLRSVEGIQRFVVEIQLGRTDESHIIRTLEYWDIERKRYPQYEHTAVIVAEDITSRFLNVISLFNGTIPLVAVRMSAVQLGETVSLLFTTVLDQVRRGLVDEDEEVHEATDRSYWENRGSKATVAMADDILDALRKLNPRLELKYNKFYIGLAVDGQPNNFVILRPQKTAIRVEPRLARTDDLEYQLEKVGFDVMGYDARWGRYRLRLQKADLHRHGELLQAVFRSAYEESSVGRG